MKTQSYNTRWLRAVAPAWLVTGTLLLSVLVATFTAPAAHAEVNMNDVRVVAVTSSKAIITVRSKRYVLKIGETTPEGVRLLKTDANGASLSNGVREEQVPLNLAGVDSKVRPESDSEELILHADSGGSFFADGAINGKPARFLVDTGASLIALSGNTARSMGIDLSNARLGMAQTASGNTRMFVTKLKEVDIGGITIYNVEAGIIEGSHPVEPLLGMSFLEKVTMHREGRIMRLSRER